MINHPDIIFSDEIVLGKYEEKSFSERDRKMTEWLQKQGF
ncbi:hypothetical protein JOC70_000250 [Clostridium pascui]|nr:hypothetical protein [Clostridium pascui]